MHNLQFEFKCVSKGLNTRVRPRFFDQVGHQMTNASIETIEVAQ